MATGYSWSVARGGSYQPLASNRLGWWAAIAMIAEELIPEWKMVANQLGN